MPVTAQQFVDWITSASAGDVVVYHVGLLMQDAVIRSVLHNSHDVAFLRGVVQRSADRGDVLLTQKRNGNNACEYRAHRVTKRTTLTAWRYFGGHSEKTAA